MLCYHRDIEKYVKTRLCDNVLEIYPEAESLKYIEDDNIFIVPEE